MAISLSGLDLSFMRSNPLPKQRGRPRKKVSFAHARSELATPSFIGDIKPFISTATPQTVEITSRSQLRAYERSNNIRQCGDYKPGQIVAENNKRWRDVSYVSEADKKAVDFKWTD